MSRLGVIAGWLVALGSLNAIQAAPSFVQTGNTLVMSNANVRLVYHLNSGTTDFYWNNSEKISGFYSGIGFNTGYVKGTSYSSWSYTLAGSNQAVVTATSSTLPTMKQYFTLDQTNSFLVRVEADGSHLSANWMGPVVVDTTGWVALGVTNDNCALVVPFDNDGFVSYNAMPINSSATGYEVAAFYDNTSRNGLVVGSITHDTWKTGIFFSGANNGLTLMNVFGGATSPWDDTPHGSVTGNSISSPTVFVGFGTDWRLTMQNFTAENTNVVPRLPWTNGVPFGWNSWGVIQQNINYTDAITVSDFFHTNLQVNGFENGGVVYINLDSYWNNLNNFELQSFVNHCHADGQKTGIYFGPFVWFGSASSATNTYVEGTTNAWLYSDILLRDGNGNYQTVDGGLAVDPTHPGTQQRMAYYINEFTNWGFDYVKLDFLSHGALEGKHYNTNVTTGIQAYNQGMQYGLNLINGRMFISESIAPLFPYQYGHSRRIACDAETSLISNTEYTMNSVTYGWWLDDLYQFNDPDVMVFNGYGATTNENQSRLINGAVTGVFLDGDDLTGAAGQSAAQATLTNAAINAVARTGQTFTPVEGNTGTSAANIFVRQENSSTWSIAVFNYSSSSTNETVSLARVGLPSTNFVATNLWDGTTANVSGSFTVSLNPKQAKLFQLNDATTLNLKWSANGNTGIWDTATSANWINLADSQETIFDAGDSVLFDDTAGVPTTVTVNGSVLPSTWTVNSSVNNYTFANSGAITGSGTLVKEGTSTLTIDVPSGFAGNVAIGGGVVYAGNNTFNNVSSIAISNGATMDLGGGQFSSIKPISVAGAGFNGEGALFNSYADYPLELVNLTMTGNTTFGGSARWDLATGSQLSGAYALTINWGAGAGYGEWNSVNVGLTVPSITLTNGSIGMKYMDTSFQNPATVFTVSSNCQMTFYNGGYDGSIHVLTGGQVYIYTAPSAFTGSTITFENNSTWASYYNTGATTPIDSDIVLNGVAHFVIGDHNMVYSGVVSGPGGFVSDYYNNKDVFTASNTYTGPTIIGNGPAVALTGNGSISHSALIFFGASGATNQCFDVSGRSDQTLTLASSQTLAGIGGINGSLVVSAGATLSPAGTNTTIGITVGANPVGGIAAANNVTLNGTTVIKLNGSGTNDQVEAGGNLTYGGTLELVNISGAPLAAGNLFPIFTAANLTGSFSSISPASPGAGLAWDLSQLPSGIIGVKAAALSPVISSTQIVGGKLVLSGSNGTAGGTYYVLSTTNVATPLTNWTVISTNTYQSNGSFAATNGLIPAASQSYYRIKQQ